MDSPDNRVAGVWYTVTPELGSVFSQTAGANDSVEFEAIFDQPRRGDPRCFVYTPRIATKPALAAAPTLPRARRPAPIRPTSEPRIRPWCAC